MAGIPRGKSRPPVSPQALKIGDALRERRLSPAVGKRQEDVALDANISQKLVSQLERGEQDLRASGLNTILGLLKALKWTLSELQTETGVDFGLANDNGIAQLQQVHTEYVQQPVYKLDRLIKPSDPIEYAWFPPAPGDDKTFTVALLIEDTEMERLGRSLHPDDTIFVRTDRRLPIPNEIYAIEHQGKVMVRRYLETPLGTAFIADNPELASQLIPSAKAKILGHVYRVFSDFNKFSN